MKDAILNAAKEILCGQHNNCFTIDKGEALVTVVFVGKTLAGGRFYRPFNIEAVTCSFSGSLVDKIP